MSVQLAKRSRAERAALLAGWLGFASALLLLAPSTTRLLLRPSAEKQKPYEQREIQDTGDIELMWRRLKGYPTASGKGDRKPCWPGGGAKWLDHAPLEMGAGPKNGVTLTLWFSMTRDSEVYLGRYTTDLWGQAQYSSWGHLEVVEQADNTRLIERIPPPKPGPPGWIAILPGQCVWGDVRPLDKKGTVGRFLIDLPAHSLLDVGCRVDEGKDIPTEWLLTFEGTEAVRVPVYFEVDDSTGHTYKTGQAGRYGIIVRRTDAPEKWGAGQEPHSRFSLMITWGMGAGTYGCNSPTYESKCFAERDHE